MIIMSFKRGNFVITFFALSRIVSKAPYAVEKLSDGKEMSVLESKPQVA